MTHTCSTIEVKLDEQIRFRLENVGYLSHEFLLSSLKNNTRHKIEVEKHSEMGQDERNGGRVDPKKSDELLWRVTEAGTFEFACLSSGINGATKLNVR
jgi:uncharacterized cupredoxin-like copper-binding protein